MAKLRKDGQPKRTGAPKGARRRTAENDKFHNFKVCSACGERKLMKDFPLADKRYRAANPRRYGPQCKECRKATKGKVPNAKRRKTEKKFNRAAYKRRTYRETRIKLFEYLADKGCCHCGTRDPRVLEFDHIDPSKKQKGIARIIVDGYSWASKTLRTEILKCRVICANCHRLHTIEQQEYYKHPSVRDALNEILDKHGYSR